MWKNIIVVITKISYLDDDYEDIDGWKDEMELWKHNFRKELAKLYKDADPTILAISQDPIRYPRKKENKVGTEQHNLMLAQMDIVYAMAAQKFIEGGSMNLSNLKYILS